MKNILFGPKAEKVITNVGKMSAPKERLLIGATAFAFKPTVDYFVNKDLDKETRTYSATKAAAKAAIGTLTGCSARYIGDKIGAPAKMKYTLPFLITLGTITFLDIPFIGKALDAVATRFRPKTIKINNEKKGVDTHA